MKWLEEFQENGLSVFPERIDKETLDQLLCASEEARRNPTSLPKEVMQGVVYLKDLSDEQRGNGSHEAAEDCPYIIGDLLKVHSAFHSLICNSHLADISAQALAVDNALFHFSNITLKPPRLGPLVGWHRDYPNKYICGTTSAQVRTLVFLHDTDQENGGLSFIPKSHKIDDADIDPQGRYEVDERQAVPLNCTSGSIAILHAKTLHSSFLNRSARPRTVVLVQWGAASNPLATKNSEWGTGKRAQDIQRWE